MSFFYNISKDSCTLIGFHVHRLDIWGGISNEELAQQVNKKEEKAKKIEGENWIGFLPRAFLKAKMFLLLIVFMSL